MISIIHFMNTHNIHMRYFFYINCTVILIDISTRIFMKSSCSREQDYIDSAKFKMTYEALA